MVKKNENKLNSLYDILNLVDKNPTLAMKNFDINTINEVQKLFFKVLKEIQNKKELQKEEWKWI